MSNPKDRTGVFDWQGLPNPKDFKGMFDRMGVPNPNYHLGVLDQKGHARVKDNVEDNKNKHTQT